jgi:hypothetical protein
MQSGVEHQEVPKKHVTVKPVGELRKWHRGRYLATEHRGEPEERTWGNYGSRKKLATTGRRMTRHAAWHKGCSHEGPLIEQDQWKYQTRDKFARGTWNGWMLRRRQLTRQEGISGNRNRDFQDQLHRGSERTSSGIYRKAFRLEIVKRIAGSSVRLQRMRDWTLGRGWPPPKWKKKLHTQ